MGFHRARGGLAGCASSMLKWRLARPLAIAEQLRSAHWRERHVCARPQLLAARLASEFRPGLPAELRAQGIAQAAL